MDKTTVNNIEDYVSYIKGFYGMEGSPGLGKCFYRGQSDTNYSLIPSLGRCFNKDLGKEATYEIFENEIIDRAKLDYPTIFNESNDIDNLAVMQHYGLPTRLLDITDNPLVALFFACDCSEKDGEVFLFSESDDCELYTCYDSDTMKKKNKIAIVRTKVRSSRQKNQQGYFLWFPKKKIKGIKKNNSLIRGIVTIPKESKETLKEELKMLGISAEKLFPDNVDLCCKELVKDITKNAFSA